MQNGVFNNIGKLSATPYQKYLKYQNIPEEYNINIH